MTITQTRGSSKRAGGRRMSSVVGDFVIQSDPLNCSPEDLRHVVLEELRVKRTQHGMIVSSLDHQGSNVDLSLRAVAPRSGLIPCRIAVDGRTDTENRIYQVDYSYFMKSQYKIYRLKGESYSSFIAGMCGVAFEKRRTVTFLCSDQVTLRILAWYMKEVMNYEFLFCTFANARQLTAAELSRYVRIMTVADFVSESAKKKSYVHDTRCICVLDEHRVTAPYQALSYCWNVLDRKYNVVYHNFSNGVSKPMFNYSEYQVRGIPSLLFDTLDQNGRRKTMLKHYGNDRLLFVLPDMVACGHAFEVICKYINKTVAVEIIPDSFSADNITTLYGFIHDRNYIILCTGWVERFFMFDFTAVYDCGVAKEIFYEDGFRERTRKLYDSECAYRRCLAPYYYSFEREYPHVCVPDNELRDLDVMLFLKLHHITSGEIQLKYFSTMVVGMSVRATCLLLAISLPPPIAVSYIDSKGYVMDNYSSALSLFQTLDYEFQSSGEVLDASRYGTWVRIDHASTIMPEYVGLNKVPQDSCVDVITRAMLIMNSFKLPSVMTHLIAIQNAKKRLPASMQGGVSELSVEHLNVPKLKPSLSEPIKVRDKVTSGDIGDLHSPLSPTTLYNKLSILKRSSTDKRKCINKKVSIVTPPASGAVTPVTDTINLYCKMYDDDSLIDNYPIKGVMSSRKESSEEKEVDSTELRELDAEEARQVSDDDSRSVYSVSSTTMSLYKRPSRLSSLKNAAREVRDRSNRGEPERQRMVYHLKSSFGQDSPVRSTRVGRGLSLDAKYSLSCKRIAEVEAHAYIIPVRTHRRVTLQTLPTSDDVLLLAKFIKRFSDRNDVGKTLALTERSAGKLLSSLCVCRNYMLSMGKIKSLPIPQSLYLRYKYGIKNVEDIVTLGTLEYVVLNSTVGHCLVDVVATAERK